MVAINEKSMDRFIMDNQKRFGIGTAALFMVFASPLLGSAAAPVMAVCVLVAGWGFYPLVSGKIKPPDNQR